MFRAKSGDQKLKFVSFCSFLNISSITYRSLSSSSMKSLDTCISLWYLTVMVLWSRIKTKEHLTWMKIPCWEIWIKVFYSTSFIQKGWWHNWWRCKPQTPVGWLKRCNIRDDFSRVFSSSFFKLNCSYSKLSNTQYSNG